MEEPKVHVRTPEYCNSKDLDPEFILLYLQQGRRTPQNEYEEKLLAEINKIQKKGGSIDIPSNGI